jgi:hypothetical protein
MVTSSPVIVRFQAFSSESVTRFSPGFKSMAGEGSENATVEKKSVAVIQRRNTFM